MAESDSTSDVIAPLPAKNFLTRRGSEKADGEAKGTSDVITSLPAKYYLGRRGSVPDAKLLGQGANSGSGLRKNYNLIQKLGFGSRLT